MNAIGYLRLSTKDQSKSLEYQESTIREYCRRNDLNVIAIFSDNGQDSYTFDRPDYRALENFIKKYKGECQYLIVLDHDRLSRNLPEALMKIAELENHHGVKVLSTNERLDLDSSDPDVFMKRAFDYMIANRELYTIRNRTRQGVRNAMENGRYLGRPPFGYRNIIGTKKNEIEIDEKRAPIIEKIFRDYLLGIPPYIVAKNAKDMGFTLSGNGAIHKVLQNHLYAGLIKVPAFKDLPEKYVKGIHKPIISEAEFWLAQKLLSNKRPTKMRSCEDFPLRGVLKCWCGLSMTAGWSKGKKDYYLYYRCLTHTNVNIPGPRLHEEFDRLIKEFSFSREHVDLLLNFSKVLLEEPRLQRQERINGKVMELGIIKEKIASLEEKFMNNEIASSTYNTWFKKYQEEKSQIERSLKDKKVIPVRTFEFYLPMLTNLFGIYEKCNVYQKHAIVRAVFKDNLAYGGGMFRTPFVDPSLAHNLLNISKKGLLFYEQPLQDSDNFLSGVPDEIRTHIVGTGNQNSIH